MNNRYIYQKTILVAYFLTATFLVALLCIKWLNFNSLALFFFCFFLFFANLSGVLVCLLDIITVVKDPVKDLESVRNDNGIIEQAFEKFEKKHGRPHSCDTRYMRKPLTQSENSINKTNSVTN